MAAKSSASSEKTTPRRKRATKRTRKADESSPEEVATAAETEFRDSSADSSDDANERRKSRSRKGSDEQQSGDAASSEESSSKESSSKESSSKDKESSKDTEPSSKDQDMRGSQSGGDSGDSNDGGNDSEQSGNRRRRRRRRGRRQRSDGDARGDSRNGNQQGRGGRGRQKRGRTPAVNNEVTGSIEGILELHPKGYGFLRDPNKNYAAQDTDAFVSSSLIEKNNLREGVLIRGDVGPGSKGQGPRLKSIDAVDGRTLEEYQQLKTFEELTPVNPFEQIRLERGATPITMRVMDLLTPVGKGQRALIVAPPRTGKTMLLQDIADSVSVNHPEVHLIVLLIDERPEEVTEMRRRVNGEVIASSMDRDVESHVRISQLIIERGKRIAEAGGEVFILLDSITRTARAFNKWVGNTGRTMSGGLDVKALDIPKKMFGTARRFDEGGSLTVVATALIDTGSRMDEVIFQEFKGTGNMELVLSRELADRRIWPSIDITLSGTRREEKILAPEVLEGVTMLRRSLISLSPVEAMEQLTRTLERFPTNAEFLSRIRSIL